MNTEKIYKLTGEENYWLLSAGKSEGVYETFRKENVIGIAWDKIKLKDIEKNSKDSLKRIVEDRYREKLLSFENESSTKRSVTFIINKLNSFVKQMKIGDIVIVKDNARSNVMFGIIESECYSNDNFELDLFVDKEVGKCNKLRKVKWIEILEEQMLLPQLKFVLQSRHAINKIESEQSIEEINRTMFSLFEFKNRTHAIFKVKTANDIIFNDYFKLLSILNEHIEKLPNNIDIKIKTNISSPGPLEIIGNLSNIKELLTGLGILGGVGGAVASYKYIKEKMKITSPGEKDEFTEGN